METNEGFNPTDHAELTKANSNTPISEQEKWFRINHAAQHYAAFMKALGFDYEKDPHSKDTPMRVAKAWMFDLAAGCFNKAPDITAFDNTEDYDGIVFQGNIELTSMCSHHHLPFVGKAHVAYIPSSGGKVIGLSKLNRIVTWFAQRPQVQESLTMQIHKYIDEQCTHNRGVAVMIEAKHMCACVRGVRHDSTMQTAKLSGFFFDNEIGTRAEFYNMIDRLKS